MPDPTPYIAPLIALAGTLAVALIGLYQWRRQHAKPNRGAAAEARRKAAEQLWTMVEEIHVGLRTFGEDSRRIDVDDDLKRLNEAFLRNSLYLSDATQVILNSYVKQLHVVTEYVRGYQQEAEEWSRTVLPAPGAEERRLFRFRRVNSELEVLAQLRVSAKDALLKQIDA